MIIEEAGDFLSEQRELIGVNHYEAMGLLPETYSECLPLDDGVDALTNFSDTQLHIDCTKGSIESEVHPPDVQEMEEIDETTNALFEELVDANAIE
jgi:hypothetical protein